ncbi:MAG: PepSY-associated TM helix domain-containing protein [Pseudomonadota bacterium]
MAFNGTDGTFVGERPSLGTAPSAGSAAFSLMGPLHFGDFAGLASRVSWLALGLGMAFGVASGLQLWVRRREQNLSWRMYGRAIDTMVWGLPLAVLSTAVFYFLTVSSGTASWWTPAGFVISACLLVPFGLLVPYATAAFQALAGLLCFALPITRQATTGSSWLESLENAQFTVVGIDFILVAIGLAVLGRLVLKKRAPIAAGEPEE